MVGCIFTLTWMKLHLIFIVNLPAYQREALILTAKNVVMRKLDLIITYEMSKLILKWFWFAWFTTFRLTLSLFSFFFFIIKIKFIFINWSSIFFCGTYLHMFVIIMIVFQVWYSFKKTCPFFIWFCLYVCLFLVNFIGMVLCVHLSNMPNMIQYCWILSFDKADIGMLFYQEMFRV